MFFVYFLLLFSHIQAQTYYDKLLVVSDLTPEECFAQNQKYTYLDGLPKCGPFDDVEGICNKYHNANEENYTDVAYKPTCITTGEFGPKQCKGERATGRCFCFDAQGARIFGQQWWLQADTMTCACSRKKAEMADSLYFNSLHCDSMGNYERLQCDVVSEQCWCADEETGSLKSPVVPEKAKNKLPCYNSLLMGSQYLRQCENKKHAQEKITRQLKLRGTALYFGELLCDGDGSYGAYTIVDGLTYCTWRDNSKLGSWQSSTHTGVNCNCARDTKIFTLAGKNQQQKCLGNGNYEEFQKTTSNDYCVDLDGVRKSPSGVRVESADLCKNYVAYH